MVRLIRFRAFLIAALLTSAFSTLAEDVYTISAPAQAHIRQRIDVNWTIPDGAKALLEIHPEGEDTRRVGYAYLHGNPQAITVPEAPGRYRIVLLAEREFRAEQFVDVVTPDASVTAPSSAGAGESIEVAWSGPVSGNDHLTFAERNGSPIRGASYSYVGNLRGAPASLRAPADAGDYDVVYVTGSTVLARAPVSVGTVTAQLSAAAEVHAGASVAVSWVGPENAQDFITFAERGGDRVGGASYTYTGNAGGDQTASLRAPEAVGAYDVVYVSSNRIIGRSPISVVEARVDITAPESVVAYSEFAVSWAGAGNAGDVIRMYRATDDGLVKYGYIDPNTDSVRLGAPKEPGEYVLRYLTRGGTERDRLSITVLPPPQPPGQLLVLQRQALLGPDDAVGVILDASGSMLQRLGDERRIAIARDTLKELVTETLPATTGFALRVFGHREVDSCRTDLEIPLGPLKRDATLATIDAINAMNLARTPLGHSIGLAKHDLQGVEGRRVLIVLTDGEETCDGDALAAIQALRNLGWDIQVNIIGFAIEDPELEQTFESWAAAGAGRYFAAADGESLRDALTRAATGPYHVVDQQTGSTIATGVPGEQLALPGGEYLLRSGEKEREVTIVPGEVSTITFGG